MIMGHGRSLITRMSSKSAIKRPRLQLVFIGQSPSFFPHLELTHHLILITNSSPCISFPSSLVTKHAFIKICRLHVTNDWHYPAHAGSGVRCKTEDCISALFAAPGVVVLLLLCCCCCWESPRLAPIIKTRAEIDSDTSGWRAISNTHLLNPGLPSVYHVWATQISISMYK